MTDGKRPDWKSLPEGIVGWSGTTKDGRKMISCRDGLGHIKDFVLIEQGGNHDNTKRNSGPDV